MLKVVKFGDVQVVLEPDTGRWLTASGPAFVFGGAVKPHDGAILWRTDLSDWYRYNLASDAWIIVSGAGSRTVGITIDGGGSAITTGVKGFINVPFSGTITGWTLLADQSGSIVIDVWKDTYANFPPTVADTITGSEKPTLSAAQKNQDNVLTTWTTAVAVGDVIGFNVDSAATVTRVTLVIEIEVDI